MAEQWMQAPTRQAYLRHSLSLGLLQRPGLFPSRKIGRCVCFVIVYAFNSDGCASALLPLTLPALDIHSDLLCDLKSWT